MSKIKSPQDKKELSLKRDRRNTFGENSKSSRKNIRLGKQRSHMGERRAVGQILSDLRNSAEEGDASEADALARATILERKQKAFRKSPDTPLGIVIQKKLTKRRNHSGPVPADARRAQLNLHSQGAFDIPYNQTFHKRVI